MSESIAEKVRQYAAKHYIRPAKSRNERTVQIRAGDIHKALGLQNKLPNVCQAIKGPRFLQENGLVIDHVEGHPSGLGSRVLITYRLNPSTNEADRRPAESPLMRLWGVGKEVFQSLGGAEAFIRSEREQFRDLNDRKDR